MPRKSEAVGTPALIIDTIPTTSGANCPDGAADFFKHAFFFLEIYGIALENAMVWDGEGCFHPDDSCG